MLAEFLSTQSIKLVEHLESLGYYCFDTSIVVAHNKKDFTFKGQRAVFNKEITTTTGIPISEQYVKNRRSSGLSDWKQDYLQAGFTQTDLLCVPWATLLSE